jgi:prohibitin 1
MSIEFSDNILLYILVGFSALILALYVILNIFDRYYSKLSKKIRGYGFKLGLLSLILLLIAMVVIPNIILPIKSGHVGVLWQRFGGTLLGAPFKEGSVMVFPWNKLAIYKTRFQMSSIKINAVSSEGLKIGLHLDFRHALNRKNVPLIHKIMGEDYLNILVIPEVESSARLIISAYTAEQVYGASREKIQQEIYKNTLDALLLNIQRKQDEIEIQHDSELKFIHLEDILIRDVLLPEKVHEAIVAKVNQMYLNQEYIVRLEVAKKEALRKVTEAKGIADFQKTVVGGISETYLRWRGIEATLELAKSNNAKIVVIGGGKDGLPLILNTADSVTSTESGSPAIDSSKKNSEKKEAIK